MEHLSRKRLAALNDEILGDKSLLGPNRDRQVVVGRHRPRHDRKGSHPMADRSAEEISRAQVQIRGRREHCRIFCTVLLEVDLSKCRNCFQSESHSFVQPRTRLSMASFSNINGAL